MRPSMTWLNNQWWLSRRQPAYDWVMSALSVVLSTQVRRHRKFGEVSCTECTGQKNDFELIQMVKMETRNPIEGYFCSEFPAICNHCRVMLAWSRKMLNIFEKCLHFLNKTSYRKIFKILFIKFSSQHRSMCCVQISWNLVDRKAVKCALLTWQNKTKFRLAVQLSLLRESRQNLPGPAPDNVLKGAPDFIQIGSLLAELSRTCEQCHIAVKWIPHWVEV